MKGKIGKDGTVTITFNPFRGEKLECPGTGQWLPCEGCGEVMPVATNVVAYFCSRCREELDEGQMMEILRGGERWQRN